jgi:hypothetical protein
VDRVRAWRRDHPGYSKRSPPPESPLPKESSPPSPTQPVDPQPSPPVLPPVALQDSCHQALQDSSFPYLPLLVGLVSLQTGSALQDDIHLHLDLMAARGREILRRGAGAFPIPS